MAIDGTKRGMASISLSVVALANNRRRWYFTTQDTNPDSGGGLTKAAHLALCVDQASFEVTAGESIDLYFWLANQGAIQAANTIILRAVYELDGAGSFVREFHNGAPPASGTSFTFYGTDNGLAGGSPRGGTLRLYIQAINTTGGLANSYNINSDDNPAATGGTLVDASNAQKVAVRGALRVNTVVSGLAANMAQFRYGHTLIQTATHSQPYAVQGHETVRIDVLEGAAQEHAGTVKAIANGVQTTQNKNIDNTWDAGIKSYGTRITPIGDALLVPDSGAILWTKFVLPVGPVANTVTVDDIVVSESDGTVSFTLTRANPSGASSVNWALANGDAVAGEPPGILSEEVSSSLSGTVNWTGAETIKTVNVTLIDNSYPEPDRKIKIGLSAPVNCTISDGTGICTIQDDDGAAAYTDDLSGNAFHLSENSANLTVNVDAPVAYAKFGKGRSADNQAGGGLIRDDTATGAMVAAGDWSQATVFRHNAQQSANVAQVIHAYGVSGANSGRGFQLLNNGTQLILRFVQEGTTPGAFNVVVDPTVGEHTLTARIDNTAKTIVIKYDGVEAVNTTYTGNPVSTFGSERVGLAAGITPRAPTVYETRRFASLVSQADLDAIVATTGKSKPLGGELSFYRLQDL